MTAVNTGEQVHLTTILGDSIEIPCESRSHQGDEQAIWILWLFPCCAERRPYAFGCDTCLQATLRDESIRSCPHCRDQHLGKHAVTHFERIDHKPTGVRR